MRIESVEIKNFRLLADATLALEEQTTVIVGRNNSGKTSLSEVIKRLMTDANVHGSLGFFPGAIKPHASSRADRCRIGGRKCVSEGAGRCRAEYQSNREGTERCAS